MIHNLNDVYNLMTTSKYYIPKKITWETVSGVSQTITLFGIVTGNRIDIKISSKEIEVYVFKNGNSIYYESLLLNTPDARDEMFRFKKLLIRKSMTTKIYYTKNYQR